MLDLDNAVKWLPLVGRPEMDDLALNDETRERLRRMHGLYSRWLDYPFMTDAELRQWDAQEFNVSRFQAAHDLALLKAVYGRLQASTKDFWRERVNQLANEAIARCKENEDYKSMAKYLQILVENNQTDKPDTAAVAYDKIQPQTFIMSADIHIENPATRHVSETEKQKLIEYYQKETAP